MKTPKPTLFFLILACTFQCSKSDSSQPERFFSKDQQTAIIRQSVLYSVKLPPQATHETKFNHEFDWFYDLATQEYDIRALKMAPDSSYFFLMTRKARSIWPAREAIGGKLKLDAHLKLRGYEEVFRTWKMTEDTLNSRAFELFDLMVKGKDLTPFQSKYKGDRYIEFPDDRYYFDRQSRRWRDHDFDSLEGVSQ